MSENLSLLISSGFFLYQNSVSKFLNIYGYLYRTFLLESISYALYFYLVTCNANCDHSNSTGGPWSPFENNWHLKEDYKKLNKRQELARKLSKHILWVGIANVVLCIPILLWQLLYTIFNYAAVSSCLRMNCRLHRTQCAIKLSSILTDN